MFSAPFAFSKSKNGFFICETGGFYHFQVDGGKPALLPPFKEPSKLTSFLLLFVLSWRERKGGDVRIRTFYYGFGIPGNKEGGEQLAFTTAQLPKAQTKTKFAFYKNF